MAESFRVTPGDLILVIHMNSFDTGMYQDREMVDREVRRSAESGYKDSTAATMAIMKNLYLELQESQFVRCIESKEDMITIAQTGPYINIVTEETQDLTLASSEQDGS